MTGRVAMLLGLFAAPAFLLWAGHHWRHTTARMRGAFWGGLIAHSAAALLATAAGVFWPYEWGAADTWRGFFGFWSMLVLFLLGALIGAAVNSRGSRAPSRDKR